MEENTNQFKEELLASISELFLNTAEKYLHGRHCNTLEDIQENALPAIHE